MSFEECYEDLEKSAEWIFIQGKANKIMPPSVKEKFQESLIGLISAAYRAGRASRSRPVARGADMIAPPGKDSDA